MSAHVVAPALFFFLRTKIIRDVGVFARSGEEVLVSVVVVVVGGAIIVVDDDAVILGAVVLLLPC